MNGGDGAGLFEALPPVLDLEVDPHRYLPLYGSVYGSVSSGLTLSPRADLEERALAPCPSTLGPCRLSLLPLLSDPELPRAIPPRGSPPPLRLPRCR